MTNDREIPASPRDDGQVAQPSTDSSTVPAADTSVESATSAAPGKFGETPANALPLVDTPVVGSVAEDSRVGLQDTVGAADDSLVEPDEADEEAAEETPRSRGQRWLRATIEWVLVIGGALLVAFLVKTFLVQAFWIPSPSMESTLQEDDRVLANKLADEISDLNRGDVVVFERVEGANSGPDDVKDLIKRVIGLPGDEVEVNGGVVYVNGTRLDESYLDEGTETDRMPEPFTVPEGHIFVMGDNRSNSHDSRMFGPVPEENIVGRAFIRIWPPSRIGRL